MEKIKKKKISNKRFKDLLLKKFKIDSVINYYGMVEQTGSIFLSQNVVIFILVYFQTFILEINILETLVLKKGMIQLLSVLPTSYPGHNILTEDTGLFMVRMIAHVEKR